VKKRAQAILSAHARENALDSTIDASALRQPIQLK